ncbi:MAG: hypothetical protein INR71_09210 [Terriglobus roseus]|nr:hypothetical protein [Terriglobus roseus]
MAPATRSQTARIAGFPGTNENGVAERKTRPLHSQASAPAKREPLASRLSDAPPVYQIDLSKPPAERYVELATDFREQIIELPSLFDEVVQSVHPLVNVDVVRKFARVLLRRLHSDELTEELRGISRVTGVEMYLLVCFNSLLDILMGCSSGGVRAQCTDGGVRMLHYRTLDWGMDALRKVVVHLEFVDKPRGRVLARSVTYVGFVGVLTGVREGLSLSLNFRPNHNNPKSLVSQALFRGHQLLVLLGRRPSIASRLRDLVLPSPQDTGPLPDLSVITHDFPSVTTTAAYIIASDGETTTVFEKDRATAEVSSATAFIAATNHDAAIDGDGDNTASESRAFREGYSPIQQLLEESVDRKECMSRLWTRHEKAFVRRNPQSEDGVYAAEGDVVKWVQKWPITNEMTHYACVMDPALGAVVWLRRWLEPLPSR